MRDAGVVVDDVIVECLVVYVRCFCCCVSVCCMVVSSILVGCVLEILKWSLKMKCRMFSVLLLVGGAK